MSNKIKILLMVGIAPGVICGLIYIIVQFQDLLEEPIFGILPPLFSIAITSIPILIGWYIGSYIDRRTGKSEENSYYLGLLFALPGVFITHFWYSIFWQHGSWAVTM